jgi:cobalt/nickel transport system permease protein
MADERSQREPAQSLAFAGAMIAGAVSTHSLGVLGAIAVIGVAAMRVRRVPLRRFVARLRATALVVGGAILLRSLTSNAHAFRDGASLAARVFDAALWATWAVGTGTPLALDAGLRALGAPRGLVALIALTRRFGTQLVRTVRSAWNATALRGGFRSLRTTASSVGSIAGVVLVRALDRAQRAQLALDLRGGDGALFASEARFSWTSWVTLFAVFGAVTIADRAWGEP